MNKTAKFFITSIITLVIGFLIGYLILGSYITSDLEFYVVGGDTNVGLGNKYEEKGVVCNIKGVDYSEDVTVVYYNCFNEQVDKIATDIVTSYYVEYKISASGINATIIRVVNIVEMEDLEINFMMWGNDKAGDCIYIKAGDTDILVDAGPNASVATTIKEYLFDSTSDLHSYVDDNKLEYVIATHAHEDHIGAFAGDSNGILVDNNIQIGTIIEFAGTNSNSKVYQKYRNAVNTLENNGTSVYTAKECYYNVNGASKVIELAVGIELEILYNEYYDKKASNENDYSVCFMLRRGEDQFLFTGDLEAEAEGLLVDNNKLGEVYLYKMGHHGSNTSSSKKLLQAIKPKVAVGTCVAFSTQYTSISANTFPTQQTITNLYLSGVKEIYVPYMVSNNKEGFEPANGHIVVKANNQGTYVDCSVTNKNFIEFDVFKEYRRWGSIFN